MTERLRVGFIGLGYMGHGMARRILARGFPLTVMAHRKREALDDLVSRGAREAATPAEVARDTDVVVLCVPGAAEVDKLLRGGNGIAAGAKPELIVIDCTTSEPSTLIDLASDFPGVAFVDAPLGRSPTEAWEGKLSVMVGADPPTLERIRPVLEAFADLIQHVGAPGSGHRLKLVNNLISLGYAALYSEAWVLARKSGISTEAFDQLVRSSRMHCPFYETFMGWARDGDSSSHQFSLATAFRTIADVKGLAATLGLMGKVTGAVHDTYADAIAAGLGNATLPELPRSVAAASAMHLAPVQLRPV